MDNPKTIRVLKLVILLCGARKYSIFELMSRLKVSERTIYRDFETMEHAGFFIDRKDGFYRIDPEKQDRHSMKIFNVAEDNLVAEDGYYYRIEKKYDGVRKNPELSESLLIVKKLFRAIRLKKQVWVMDYRSTNSNSIYKRLVEPIEFSFEKQGVWAYEIASEKCKRFKISRIGDIIITNKEFVAQSKHLIPFTDIFNFSSACPIDTIILKLDFKAYYLFCEEFPDVSKLIKEKDYHILNVPVAAYEGIGRFVLGLIDHIEVIQSIEFKRYLRKMVAGLK